MSSLKGLPLESLWNEPPQVAILQIVRASGERHVESPEFLSTEDGESPQNAPETTPRCCNVCCNEILCRETTPTSGPGDLASSLS